MTEFEPDLSILPDQQRRILPELAAVPESFVLCGGTAIALQLGHRTSLDFDFVASHSFDPDELQAELPFLRGSLAIQKAANTLTCQLDRGGPVQVSFFGTPTLRLIKRPLIARGTNLRVASLLDMSAMKAALVQKRAEARDYLDIEALMTQGRIDLSTALAAAQARYGAGFNPELTLKALTFFGDGNLHKLPPKIQDRLRAAVRSVDLSQLPTIARDEP